MIGLVLESGDLRSQIVPRQIYCVIEETCRNPKIAEDACNGTFTNAGQRLQIGSNFNWNNNPFPTDEEWHIEWSKFYFGLDLADAYQKRGDTKYVSAWKNLVEKWIDEVKVGSDSSDVSARRIQNWIYAWMIFSRGPSPARFSAGFTTKLCRSLRSQTEHLRANLTAERNHRTLELYSLFVFSLALPQLDRAGELLEFAIVEMAQNATADIKADGVHREQSTHYHAIVLRSFLGLMLNARRFSLSLPQDLCERVEKACDFAMQMHRPDGFIPALSDSDTGSYLDLLRIAGALFNRSDLTFVGTRGNSGEAPKSLNAGFECGGYFVQRSGWDKNARFLMFDCGPIGDGGHGHYDLLNIELAANGKPLIVDTGRFTYSEEGPTNWRRFFKSTRAHNTVSIDGLDQINYRRGKPKGSTANGRLIESVEFDGVSLVAAEAESSLYDTIHTRRVFFISDEYWIIWDHLRGAQTRDFDLRFHLTPDAWNRVSVIPGAENSLVVTPDLALILEANAAIQIEPSWYSPEYGIKHRIPCVSVAKTNISETNFLTIIQPRERNQKFPTAVIAGDSNAASFKIISADTVDRIDWRFDGKHLQSLSFSRTEVAP